MPGEESEAWDRSLQRKQKDGAVGRLARCNLMQQRRGRPRCTRIGGTKQTNEGLLQFVSHY